jgi:hypothetical protein
MKKAFLFITTVAICSQITAASPRASTLIPKRYHGDWVLEGRTCDPGPSDSGNMRISAAKILNFESASKVTRVKIWGGRIEVHTRTLHGSGKFGSWNVMSLSADRQRLMIGEHKDNSDFYKRCRT